MKLTASQIQSLAEKVLDSWKKNNVIEFKTDEKKVLARMIDALKQDLQKEIDLDREVHQMLDNLERAHQGEFERYKMYPLLKRNWRKIKR